MIVIDVDAHFEPGKQWLEQYPSLAARLPKVSEEEFLTRFVAGDLLADVPREAWPPIEQLAPPGIAAINGRERVEGFSYDEADQRGVVDPAIRMAWLDRNGIDVENIICLEGLGYARFLDDRDLAREAIGACNDWMSNALAEYPRLMPVTAVDLADLDWTIAELTKMRGNGSRAFLIPSTPVDGIPLIHPHFDGLWSAVTHLGMVPMVHVGFNPARFDPGWANTGGDMVVLRQMAVCQQHQSVQVLLNGMVFGGVFERHPELTVLLCELGVHWFPATVEHMESRNPQTSKTAEMFFGKYEYPLSPGEFVRRNVRITPLPALHQTPVAVLSTTPECAVFSSDYAHNEGNPAPIAHYEALLADLDAETRASFYGASIAECYARMCDPLPVPASK